MELVQPPVPLYSSWADYKKKQTVADARAWCAKKVRVANRPRLMSGSPAVRITTDIVFGVLVAARGRCFSCGSLALEGRPSNDKGHPLPWENVGRRIGSLGHRVPVVAGGTNRRANLVWECLWCNTWPRERLPGAVDHGAIQIEETVTDCRHPERTSATGLTFKVVCSWCQNQP